jgi:hypothetical protein
MLRNTNSLKRGVFKTIQDKQKGPSQKQVETKDRVGFFMPKSKREVMVKEIQDAHFKTGFEKNLYQTTNQYFGTVANQSEYSNTPATSVSLAPVKKSVS